jgi:hypothetical protein
VAFSKGYRRALMVAACRGVPRVTAPQQTLITTRGLDLPLSRFAKTENVTSHSVLFAAVTLTLSAHRS